MPLLERMAMALIILLAIALVGCVVALIWALIAEIGSIVIYIFVGLVLVWAFITWFLGKVIR